MQVSHSPGPEYPILKTGVLLLVFLPDLLHFMAVGAPQSKLHRTDRFLSSQNAPFPYQGLK
jgi:hypothetical protein